MGKMKLATFNANGIRARLPVIEAWLDKEVPDVLCIQETKVQDLDFPKESLEKRGYHCAFCGQKSYNGVAILSRPVPQAVTYGFGDGDAEEGPRLMTVWIEGLPIVNTYVPQGQAPDSERFDYKLAWFGRLRDYFSKEFNPDRPLLWAGDFNVAPDAIDVYDPDKLDGSVGFHPEERAALVEVARWGLVDVFRLHDSEARKYTFWDYRIPNGVKRGLGWRIDHIWATRSLAECSEKAWIDMAPRLAERPSDHTFLVAEFELD